MSRNLIILIVVTIVLSAAVAYEILTLPKPNFDYRVEQSPQRKHYLIRQVCERRSKVCYNQCVQDAWKEIPLDK